MQSKYQLKYYRTKKGVASSIYNGQKYAVKNSTYKTISYSKKEFEDWLFSNEKFNVLYDRWVNSGYIKGLKPSVDRIDANKGYSFDNIQLMTWAENELKGRTETSNKTSMPVLQIKNGVIIAEYRSMNDACRITGIVRSTLWETLRGTYRVKPLKNCYWEFKKKDKVYNAEEADKEGYRKAVEVIDKEHNHIVSELTTLTRDRLFKALATAFNIKVGEHVI
jgi:hypothetical protein